MMWQPGHTLASVEKDVILAALKFFHGNKSQTARALGIAPNTLASKLDQYEPAAKPVEPVKEVPAAPVAVTHKRPKKVS